MAPSSKRALVAITDPSLRDLALTILTRTGLITHHQDDLEQLEQTLHAEGADVVLFAAPAMAGTTPVSETTTRVTATVARIRAAAPKARIALISPVSDADADAGAYAACPPDAVLQAPLSQVHMVALLTMWGLSTSAPGYGGNAMVDLPIELPDAPGSTWPNATLPERGTFATVPSVRVFFHLRCGRFTGTLETWRWGQKVVFWLLGGLVVGTGEADPSAGLIAEGQARGRIDEAMSHELHAIIAKTGCPELDAVVYAGLLSERACHAWLQQTHSQRIASTVAWQEGTYHIKAHGGLADGTVPGIDPLAVCCNTARETWSSREIIEVLAPQRKRYLARTAHFAAARPWLEPHLQGIDLGTLITGAVTFEEALITHPDQTHAVAIALRLLLQLCLIEAVPKAQKAPPTPPRAGGELASYPAITTFILNLDAKMRDAAQNHYASALELAANATPQQIIKAHEQMLRIYAPDQIPLGAPPETAAKLHSLRRFFSLARDALLKDAGT